MVRMDAIANYKACHLLTSQLKQTSGAKVTKLLGRCYLRTTIDTWAAVRESAANDIAGLRVPEHTTQAFLDGWARAVSGDDGDVGSLVWAVDFQGELEKRKKARLPFRLYYSHIRASSPSP